jgi:hypothetical protein
MPRRTSCSSGFGKSVVLLFAAPLEAPCELESTRLINS